MFQTFDKKTNTIIPNFKTIRIPHHAMTPTNNGHNASPQLTPFPDTTIAERGRDRSPRSGGYGGRKGYNNVRPATEMTPPTSTPGTSPRPPHHREGLFGRKGFNASPGASPAGSRENSPAASPSALEGALRGRKGYNDAHGSPHGPAMQRTGSHDASPVRTFRDGLSGRRSREASPHTARVFHTSPSPSPQPHDDGRLGGRKGFNASPRLSPKPEEMAGGYGGRKGYNAERADPAVVAEVVEGRRRPSRSPAGPHHQHHGSEHKVEQGLGIFHDGGHGGRKGYNSSPSSRGTSPVPPRQ